MNLNTKILLSIIPTLVLLLMVSYIMEGLITLNVYVAILSNILLLIQTIYLYKMMVKNNIVRNDRLFYTFLLVSFLPFHYILIWRIIDKNGNVKKL